MSSLVAIPHFANEIKIQLLGGYVLKTVTANYNEFEDKTILGLVFMHEKTDEEKTLFFYDSDKINYHIAPTNNIKIFHTKKFAG